MNKFFVCLISISLNGCGIIIPVIKSESKLSKISLGMQKETVIRRIGKPDVARGAIEGEELHEYRLYEKGESLDNFFIGIFTLTVWWWIPSYNNRRYYWLSYKNDLLVKYGEAGDWQPNKVIEYRQR